MYIINVIIGGGEKIKPVLFVTKNVTNPIKTVFYQQFKEEIHIIQDILI